MPSRSPKLGLQDNARLGTNYIREFPQLLVGVIARKFRGVIDA
jgi:hypothetical protein